MSEIHDDPRGRKRPLEEEVPEQPPQPEQEVPPPLVKRQRVIRVARTPRRGTSSNLVDTPRRWIEVELFDLDGVPLGNRPVEVSWTLDSEEPAPAPIQLTLNAFGCAHVDLSHLPEEVTHVTVKFPGTDVNDLLELRQSAQPHCGGAYAMGPGTAWIELERLDEDGRPIPRAPYRL
ncbi:hypothetical protein HPC49_47845, partial [Pyxidicoccus fallax]|nr:hypothetical protein [Pyxidicoccus fallax]